MCKEGKYVYVVVQGVQPFPSLGQTERNRIVLDSSLRKVWKKLLLETNYSPVNKLDVFYFIMYIQHHWKKLQNF